MLSQIVAGRRSARCVGLVLLRAAVSSFALSACLPVFAQDAQQSLLGLNTDFPVQRTMLRPGTSESASGTVRGAMKVILAANPHRVFVSR